MASDDNVVRLKHLQPLANGISTPNGDNVVKLKHLVSLASAIADEAHSQQPALSLGSWSAVDTVYSAPIIYDGDGTLSVNIGSISNGSLIVADEDGSFSGVLTASAGESYAPAVATFNYNTDYVTIQSGEDIPDSIISSLGSKFVPTVSTSADFIDNADNNIQFFDNKLSKFFTTTNDYRLFSDDGFNQMQYGFKNSAYFAFDKRIRVYTYFSSADNKNYVFCTPGDSEIVIGADTATLEYYYTLCKLSETTGFIYYTADRYNGDYNYKDGCRILPFSVNSSGSLVKGSVLTIISAATSSVASHEHTRRVSFAQSCLNPKSFTWIMYQEGNNNPISSAGYINVNNRTGAPVTVGSLTMGTVYASPNGKNNLEYFNFNEQYPAVIQFNGEDVTLSKSKTPKYSPFIYYKQRTRNSSGSITSGADYVRINAGGYPTPDSYVQISTITSGVQSTLNAWVEDNGYFIHGTYPNKARTDCYVVTYKPGTYSKDSYLQDAFKVWNVDFTTPLFVQSSKTLPQVLDDFDI